MATFQRNRSPPGGESTEAVFTRATLAEVNVPEFVKQGESFRVTGTADFKSGFAGVVAYPADVRVRISGAGIEKEEDVGVVRGGEQLSFSIPVTPDVPAGRAVELSVVAEANAAVPLSGWDTIGSRRVTTEVVTEEDAQVRSVTGYLPWAAGGAAVGAAYSSQTKGFVDRQDALVGAGLGAAARPLLGGFSIPSFPTKNTLALAALLGAGALAVNQVSNIPTPDPSVVTDRLPGSGSGSRS
jgi:hypothetical protein